MSEKWIHYFIVSLFTFISLSLSSQTLSSRQKLNDFDYLFNLLKENYPYFEVQKRQTGYNWTEHRDEFRKMVEQTNTDKEFLEVISSILDKLQNGHTDLLPTFERNYYLKIYQQDASRKAWASALQEGTNYWPELLNQEQKIQQTGYSNEAIRCYLTDSGHVAVIELPTFNKSEIQQAKDMEEIRSFLKKNSGVFNQLIIDIQDNGGGNDSYWQNYLVPLLTDKTINYKSYLAYRKSDFLENYYAPTGLQQESFKVVKKLPARPKELNASGFNYVSGTTTIESKGALFTGKIYLLVNHVVFSSSESFAAFCKASNWATVIGETTGGDGIGFDPVIACLPSSKLLFRFPGNLGINQDGSINDETHTQPDHVVEARNSQERLLKAVQFIDPAFSYTYHPVPPVLNYCKADVLIYPTNERTDSLNNAIKSQVLYLNERFFHAQDSLILPDTVALKRNLAHYNITVYGSLDGNLWIKKHLNDSPLRITKQGVKTTRLIPGTDLRIIFDWFNEDNNYTVRFYTAQTSEGVLFINRIFHGGTNYVIGDFNGKILESGNFRYQDERYLSVPAK